MSELKLPAANGGGSISIKGPSSSGDDVDLLDTSGNLKPSGQMYLNDDKKLILGTGGDMEIYHLSDQNYIYSGNGRINLRASEVRCENAAGTEVLAKFIADGACELRHNDSAKLTTTANGIVVSGALEVNGGDVDFSDHLVLSTDSKAIKFGADSDLQIYHDGSHGYLKNTTGDFYLQGTTGENHIVMNPNAGVKLLYDDGIKLQTTSTGVTVSGSIWCGTNGTGISFESSNNNGQGGTSILFDDYEEGTWTPGWGGWSNITYDSRSGRYTKIGRIVHAVCHINTGSSSTNTSGGHVYITGLPFTVANQNAAEGGATIGLSNIMTSSTGNPVPMINLSANTVSAYFYHSNGTAYSDSHMSGADGHIRVTFIYEAA